MNRLSSILILTLSFVLAGITSAEMNNNTEVLKWEILSDVEWEWKDEFYEAKFNEKQRELDGKEIIIEGFMFPLEYSKKHKNFLVSASPMSDCFFCGPGEAESMVYVKTDEAVDYTYSQMKVEGTFKLVSDASMGIIYELENARVVE
jgi:hypothetical protein